MKLIAIIAMVAVAIAVWALVENPSNSDPEATPPESLKAETLATVPAPTAQTPSPEPQDTVSTNYVEISTPLGSMVVRLYNETPGHRDNFLKLVDEGFYNGTSFHRIIGNFMAQGGDPNSKDDDLTNDGQGGPGYTVPAEFDKSFFHRKGALAAARQGDFVNPTRASSGSQFYLVLGSPPFDDPTLDMIEQRMRTQIPDPGFAFSDSARVVYSTKGGAPHLDGMYTIFGELVDGFDTLDRLGKSPTMRSTGVSDPRLADQPVEKLTMTVRRLESYPKQ